MKFSGKMCLTIILKVTKNHYFTICLEDTFFEKPQGGEDQIDTPPRHFRVKYTQKLSLDSDYYFLFTHSFKR